MQRVKHKGHVCAVRCSDVEAPAYMLVAAWAARGAADVAGEPVRAAAARGVHGERRDRAVEADHVKHVAKGVDQALQLHQPACVPRTREMRHGRHMDALCNHTYSYGHGLPQHTMD